MNKIVVLGLAALAALPVACGDDDDHPAASTGGGSGGKISGSGGESSDANGGAIDDVGGAAQGGAGADLPPIGTLGGLGPVAGGGAPDTGPTLCDIEAKWSEPTALAGIATDGADERLLTMTHDELSLVFTRDDVLMLADRADVDASFAAPSELALPSGYTSEYGVGLSADALTLVVVSTDRESFAELTRSARGEAFTLTAKPGRFAQINDNNQFVHAYLSSPVLAQSGATAFYTQQAGESSRVYRADGAAKLVPRAMPEDAVTLGSDDGDAKLTLSASADLRTLFVLDEALGHVTGLWNSAVGAPYTQDADFAGLESVFTNESCERLYGTATLGGSLDVVVETAN